jgi:hypothetical protein
MKYRTYKLDLNPKDVPAVFEVVFNSSLARFSLGFQATSKKVSIALENKDKKAIEEGVIEVIEALENFKKELSNINNIAKIM